jgi:hypothetical protein
MKLDRSRRAAEALRNFLVRFAKDHPLENAALGES